MIHFTFLRKRTRFLLLLSSFFVSCQLVGSKQTPTEVTPTGTIFRLQSPDNRPKPGLVKLTPQEVNELKIKVLTVSGNVSNYQISVPGCFPPRPTMSVSSVHNRSMAALAALQCTKDKRYVKARNFSASKASNLATWFRKYLQAVSEEKYQTSRLQRLEQLVEQTISSKNELDRTQSDYQRATTAAIAAKAKLKAIGVPDHEIEAYKVSEQIDPTLKIHSPISGVLDQRTVELGQAVNALETLARVLDNNPVLIRGYVFSRRFPCIHEGDSVKISQRQGISGLSGYYGFELIPALTKPNRSVVINILATTQAGWPKTGENVRLDISTSTAGQVYCHSARSSTYDETMPIVLYKINESTYEKRVVQGKRIPR
jgi:cobalt-zinc-cadmium efflux system membrane fusion protein